MDLAGFMCLPCPPVDVAVCGQLLQKWLRIGYGLGYGLRDASAVLCAAGGPSMLFEMYRPCPDLIRLDVTNRQRGSTNGDSPEGLAGFSLCGI